MFYLDRRIYIIVYYFCGCSLSYIAYSYPYRNHWLGAIYFVYLVPVQLPWFHWFKFNVNFRTELSCENCLATICNWETQLLLWMLFTSWEVVIILNTKGDISYWLWAFGYLDIDFTLWRRMDIRLFITHLGRGIFLILKLFV